MYFIFGACVDIVAACVFLVPILLVEQRGIFRDWKKTGAYFVFCCYLVAVYSIVGLPNIMDHSLDFTYNFVPFMGLTWDVHNVLLNVALFVPLGMLLPMVWDRFKSLGNTMLFGFGMTVVVEGLQVFTHRATDIDDIITNVIGTLVGYLIAWIITKRFTRFCLMNKRNIEICLIIGNVVLIMFLLEPFVSAPIWDSISMFY